MIEQEADIENYINQNAIVEGEKVRLYNFDRKIAAGHPKDPKHLSKYTLLDNDKMYCQSTNCITYSERSKNTKYEVVYELKDWWADFPDYEYGAMMAEEKFPNLRTCNLCKYHAMRDPLDFDFEDMAKKKPIICLLFKKFGLPKFCQDQAARDCKYYRKIDKQRLEELKQQVLSYEVWCEHV